MKVALLGYDVEGKSSYTYYQRLGAAITICDQNEDLVVPEGVATQLGSDYLQNLERFDLLVRTAGLPLDNVLEAYPGAESKLTTHINEFLRVCPTKNVIGITGTKGKGTTCTLATKILQAAGKDVHLGGNIGIAPLDFLPKLTPESWVVLELSSFQLIDIQYSTHIAVCLMVVPEHLNWHADMQDYLRAKSRLFAQQNSDDIAIFFSESPDSRTIGSAGAGCKLPFFTAPGAWVNGNMLTIAGQEICTTDEIKLLGRHNWQNACAAVTATWNAGVKDVEALRSVLTTFAGLEHRLEFVREIDGVKYYDDSFGTTPETAIVALQVFAQHKVLILGGSDKGASYVDLGRAVAKNTIRKVLLIGSEAAKMQAALEKAGFTNYTQGGNSMSEILGHARRYAQAGDIVLLSTGCASFDMFENYKDRGEQFKTAVQALA